MNRLVLAVLVVLLVAVLGAGIFLATWDIPPPTARVEKVLPNDRLGR